MKKKDVYIGTVKKCLSIYRFEKYGDRVMPHDLREFNIEYAVSIDNIKIVDTNAVLIKIGEDEYMWKNNNKSNLINFGPQFINIKNHPSADFEYFVDETRLKPYFEDDLDENVKVKSLKRK